MAAETVCLGIVTEHEPYKFTWSVSKLLGYPNCTVESPIITIHGQQFCLLYTPIQQQDNYYIDVNLKAIASQYGYASATFALTMACQNRVATGLPMCLKKQISSDRSTASGVGCQHFVAVASCKLDDMYLFYLETETFEGPAVGLQDSLLLPTPLTASNLAQFYR